MGQRQQPAEDMAEDCTGLEIRSCTAEIYAQKITLVMAASLLLTDSYIVADRKSVTNNQMNLKFDYLNTALRTSIRFEHRQQRCLVS